MHCTFTSTCSTVTHDQIEFYPHGVIFISCCNLKKSKNFQSHRSMRDMAFFPLKMGKLEEIDLR